MIVDTDRLSKAYGSVWAVRDLNLKVPEGRISAFLGPNGHGKSTTIKMLLGMAHPTSGSGSVLGFDIADPRRSIEIRRRTAFVSEDKALYGYMTGGELIAFTRGFYPAWRPEVERRLVESFDLPLNRPIKQLSKGMRTKLALVLALARGAELLILDEPSEGLDPVMLEVMLEAVVEAASGGATVFFSSHQLSEAERIADHVFILNRGSVVLEGSLDDLREQYRRVNAVFVAPPQPGDIPQSLINVRKDGNVLTALAREPARESVERLRAAGAMTIDVHPIGLRELFLESVTELRDVA